MPTKRTLPDEMFGQIIIRTHRLARRITMRTKEDGLHITVPPLTRTSKVMEIVEEYRSRLYETWERTIPQPLDIGFRIDAPCFRLRVEQGNWNRFTVRFQEEETVIFCPKGTDFKQKSTQDLLKNAIVRAMKRRAEVYLPPILKEFAEAFGLTYRQIKITKSRSRWGSCSTTKNINLSCYLMLLPSHLMDYVLLHELAHTREMNHGPQFWELLDNLTEGQAHTLRKELRNFKIIF